MKRWESYIVAWSEESRTSKFGFYPTPLLESLCVTNFAADQLSIFPDTPMLKHLVTTSYYQQIGTGVPLPCMESAEISEGRFSENHFSFGYRAIKLLRQISEVRFLNILVGCGRYYSLLEEEEPLRFPNLVELRLEGDIKSFLIQNIKAPRLNSLTLHVKSDAGPKELLDDLAEADLPELSRLDLDLIKDSDPHWTLDEVGPSVIGMLSTKETLRTVIDTAELEEVVAGCRKRLPSSPPRLVFSLRVSAFDTVYCAW